MTPANLTHCTLTGIDERTDLSEVIELSRSFPIVEWGILYSPKRQGQPGRYPSVGWIINALKELPRDVRVAVHICGQGVHNLLSGFPGEFNLADRVSARGGRIQLNFNQTEDPVNLDDLVELLDDLSPMTFITQHNAANQNVWRRFVGLENHAVLFDASGGRGIKSDYWPEMLPIPCGYAGGLGPDNIQTELVRIASVAGTRPTWVDMEGKLRITDESGADWLDLAACQACLEAAQAHVINRIEMVA